MSLVQTFIVLFMDNKAREVIQDGPSQSYRAEVPARVSANLKLGA